jgi:hypothetical protein
VQHSLRPHAWSSALVRPEVSRNVWFERSIAYVGGFQSSGAWGGVGMGRTRGPVNS